MPPANAWARAGTTGWGRAALIADARAAKRLRHRPIRARRPATPCVARPPPKSVDLAGKISSTADLTSAKLT